MEELWELVRRIPKGKVAAYGALGQALTRPLSGFLVGRMMATCPQDVPWWRVVARDGQIPVDKRDPRLGSLQRKRLEADGVPMTEDDRVAVTAFVPVEELLGQMRADL